MRKYLFTGPDLTEEQKEREAQAVRSFLMTSDVGPVINELWLDLAKEETKALTEPQISREEAYRRADELRLQRLMLERLIDEMDDRLDFLNKAGDANEDTPATNSE